MRPRFAIACTFTAATLAGECLASDAYDDDQDDQRPEDDWDHDEEEEGESTDSLKSGGLVAPGALPESGDDRSEIEKDLDESDEKDAGRGLEFVWLGAEIGFQTMGLATFGNRGLVAEGASSGGSGLVYGGAAGLRLLYFTLGARFRRASFHLYSPWSLLGEAGLRIPLGQFEPYGTVSGGYIGISDVVSEQPIGGVDLRLGGGFDYYFSDSFSVGSAVGADLLFLSAGGASSTGGGVTATALVGLHF
jgi:hypothetical protein